MEQSHMAAENIGEHWRMLRMKFYVTAIWAFFMLLYGDIVVLVAHSLNNIVRKVILKKEQEKKNTT